MAASIGRMIEILELPEVRERYNSTIRKMQPVELVRRLESEQVSTNGEMYELRGRLLRLEILKMQPKLDVPWYPEDDVPEECVLKIKRDEFHLNENTTIADTPQKGSACKASELLDTLYNRVEKFEEMVSRYLALKDELKDLRQHSMPIQKSRDKQIVESVVVSCNNAQLQIDDESSIKVNECVMDDETGEIMTVISDGSSIVEISRDDEEFEKLDQDSMHSWDQESMWSRSSTSSVCQLPLLRMID